MNLAAESISRVAGEVWNDLTCGRRATGVVFWAAKHWLCEITALLNGRRTFEPLATLKLEKNDKNLHFGQYKRELRLCRSYLRNHGSFA